MALAEISDISSSDYGVKPVQEMRKRDIHDLFRSQVGAYSQDILWRLPEIFRRDDEGSFRLGIAHGEEVRETLRETYYDS